MRIIIIFLICAIMHGAVNAATCDAGFYLENGECKHCKPKHEPFFCPGDDIRYPCPITDTDYEKLSGWTKISGREAKWSSIDAKSANNCYCEMYFKDSHDNQVLIERPFNGENYWSENNHWWYAAGNGYYLSGYDWSSSIDFYVGAKPCTNAPPNAHYTGPGTPDAPDGSVIDANDCPWACDAGFGKSASGECLPLCNSGMTTIRTNSIKVPLFLGKHTSPALAVEYAGRVCYADLVLGNARPAINISYNGQVFHTVNE